MADEQSQQTAAGVTSNSTSASGATPVPAQQGNSVDDLLAMWANDDVALGEKNPQVKPAQLEATAAAPAPVQTFPPTPTPRPVPTASPISPAPTAPQPPAPSAPVPAPVPVAPSAPLPPRPAQAPVAPQPPRPVAPAPVAPNVPMPMAPAPMAPQPRPTPPAGPIPSKPMPPASPMPMAPAPVAPQPPRPVAPAPAAPSSPMPMAPQPPRPVAPAPVAPSAPLPPRPAPAPVAPQPPRPVAPSPVAPSAPAPMPMAPAPIAPTPRPMPPAGPIPSKPTQPASPMSMAPAPVAPQPPRPVAPAPVAPSAPLPPRPAPAPVAPQPPRPVAPSPSAPIPPRPTPAQTTPAPSAPPPPRPAPAPTPSRPEPVKKIDAQNAIEAEFIDDEDTESALAAADILSSIKNKEEPQSADDSEGFVAQLKELLHELGITPGKIVRLVIYIIVFIALVYGINFAWGKYGSLLLEKIGIGTTPSQVEETKLPETPAQSPEKIGVENTVENGIDGSVQVGAGIATEPIYIRDIGIQAGVVIGEAARSVTPFAKYITQFKLLENAYQVDINKLLDQSTDRRARFKSQLSLMNQLYKEANETLGDVQQELDITNSELTKRTSEQNTTETAFFEQLTALNGQVAEGLLSDFTRTAQQVVTLKARYRALQRLERLYVNALPRFERRIRDLELNQEPLISGLKIYDVAGSDLELIVPVQDAGTTPRSSSSPTPTSARPGIVPIISPQEFKDVSGTDYITAPGGGF